MSLIRHVSLVVIVLLVATIVPVGTTMAKAKDPFVGAWTAIDIPDGSLMRVAIGGGGGVHRFNLYDHGGSTCGVFDPVTGDPKIPAVYRGTGTHPEGDPVTLDLEGDVWCLYRDARGRTLMDPPPAVSFVYSGETDTLTGFDVVWFRLDT